MNQTMMVVIEVIIAVIAFGVIILYITSMLK